MKKIIFLSFITCIIFPIHTNQIKESVQQLYDKIRPEYEAMLEEQHRIIKILNHVEIGEEGKVLIEDPKTKEFLRIFYTLDPQASGIQFCQRCLKGWNWLFDEPDKDVNNIDLLKCYEEWRKSENYQIALRTVHALDNHVWKVEMNDDSHELSFAFYQGEHEFNEWFQKTIKENSQENK